MTSIVPYKDEVLFSILGRHRSRLLLSGITYSSTYLGRTNTRLAFDLPSGISKLVQRLIVRGINSPEELIYNHTLYPYYKPFLSDEKRVKVLNLMISSSNIVQNYKPKDYSIIRNHKIINYCPVCISQDIEAFGETYIHRIHQIPGLFICPFHNTILHQIHPTLINEKAITDINEFIDDLTLEVVTVTDNRLLKINNILALPILKETLIDYSKFYYKGLLYNTPYEKYGRIDHVKLSQSFIQFYSRSALQRVLTENQMNLNWIKIMISKPKNYNHPVRHLLLYNFLSETPKQIIAPPFGKGPWVCINAASAHFGQKVIDSITIKYNWRLKKMTGILACSCGMVYQISHINKNNKIVDSIRVKDYGKLWRTKLKELLDKGHSLYKISSDLRVNFKQIKKQKSLLLTGENKSEKTTLSQKRKEWINLISTQKSVEKAKQKDIKLYKWLLKNDSDWFKVSNKLHTIKKHTTGELRLNWKEIDERTVDEIKKHVQWLKLNNYKGRITKSLLSHIIKRVNYLSPEKQSHLPKTLNLLKSISESSEQHQINRIMASVKDILSVADQPSPFKVMRKAGMKYPVSQKVKDLIALLTEPKLAS